MPQARKPLEVEGKQSDVLSVEAYAKLVERVRKAKSKAEENSAFNQILDAMKPRIKNLCGKFNIPGLSYDDIYQEALIALRTKAIKDYDKTRGAVVGTAPFDRFAMLCIRRHLATELKTSHQVRKTALNTAISLTQDRGDSDEELSLINILPDGEGNVLNLVARKEYYSKLVQKLLSKLSPLETEVFMLFIERYTYSEIADIVNSRQKCGKVNIKGVDNALSRVKSKADKVFARYGDNDLRVRDAVKTKSAYKRRNGFTSSFDMKSDKNEPNDSKSHSG